MFDRDSIKVRFPLSAFLHQPIGHPIVKLILNPIKFKKLYWIWMLEMSLTRDMVAKDFDDRAERDS
jgi:hypothetical protein